MLAGKLYGIPVKGTMAHSFVTSFENGHLRRPNLKQNEGNESRNLQELAQQKMELLQEKVCYNII